MFSIHLETLTNTQKIAFSMEYHCFNFKGAFIHKEWLAREGIQKGSTFIYGQSPGG